MTAQLHARDLAFSHGPTLVLARASVQLAAGDRVGIVGPNGVGKSTLMRLLAGELVPAAGTVRRVPADATVGLLRQELEVDANETVDDLIARRTGVAAADAALDRATTELEESGTGATEAAERHAAALDRWLRLGGDDLAARASEVLARVGLDPGRHEQPVSTMSGGEQARVGLAALLLSRFDLLLLDEPTNDLDLDGLAQLEQFVLTTTAPMMIVSHDRRFLDRVVTSVLEIDDHARTTAQFGGGWQAYLDLAADERRHAAERFATYTDQRDRLQGRARRERQWATSGVKKEKAKRSTDNDKIGRNLRIERTEQLAARARRTQKALERLDTVDKPWEGWELRFSIAAADRGSTVTAELIDAVVDHDRSFTFGPVTLTIRAGERVAITGVNGAGKTTMLRVLLGELDLTGGRRSLGSSVVVGQLEQTRDRFAGTRPLIDVFIDELDTTPAEARSTLAKFGLSADHVDRSGDHLSPGERTRAALAAFQLRGVNLLVLDEPTNHLDLPAIEQLEQALDTYPGTLLVVTHDRAFLEALHLTRRLELVDGRVTADEPLA